MPKPKDIGGYSVQHTADCERVLATLLRGLGPWGKSVFLVGGLTPRYLVPEQPPAVPPHAGTLDVDVVIDLQILADTEAYESLEANLRRLNFERAENEQGKKVAWRWKTRTEHGATMILEFLAEDLRVGGGRVQALPTEGNISALNIPHSSIVFDLYEEAEIRAELLDGKGIATVTVKHANIVSFTCLKAFAYEDRHEPKDAHDLMYCLEHRSEGLQAIAATFRTQLAGKHGSTVRSGLELLRSRFVDEPGIEGYKKDGPVAVAMFELGPDTDLRERRALRQREASSLIDRLLRDIEVAPTGSS
jgi:hypothetical protein